MRAILSKSFFEEEPPPRFILVRSVVKYYLVVFMLLSTTTNVHAACSNAPVGNDQDRVIQMVANSDGWTMMGAADEVDTTEEGTIVYDASHKTIAVCDGTSWVPLNGGVAIPLCKADMSNIQIGSACDDGSKFVGSHPNFSWQGFYVTDINQSVASNWADSLALCDNLNRHGHGDWYLPSKNELNLLYLNKNALGGFSSDDYWSSTNQDSDRAWYQYFTNGIQGHNLKTNTIDVRCVRRE